MEIYSSLSSIIGVAWVPETSVTCFSAGGFFGGEGESFGTRGDLKCPIKQLPSNVLFLVGRGEWLGISFCNHRVPCERFSLVQRDAAIFNVKLSPAIRHPAGLAIRHSPRCRR